MATLYGDYEQYLKKYKIEYGENTVLFYECGSFMEVYSIDDGLVDIKTISELLNVQVSRRNKSILEVSKTNTLMLGFPSFALPKFSKILVENNYTVVVVSQVTPPPKPKRAVTQIMSPGTSIEIVKNADTQNLVSIYIEDVSMPNTGHTGQTGQIMIGFSCIDLSTGKSQVAEFASRKNDTTYAIDELYRIISITNPKEIIVFGDTHLPCEHFIKSLDLQHVYCHDKLNMYPKDFKLLSFQNAFLKKVFNNTGIISIIEYLDMAHMPLAIISYVMLLNFAYKHNESILTKIDIPQKIMNEQNLVLSYNALRQLNIDALIHILNKCSTAIGQRYFKERIRSPYRCQEIMTKSWDAIEQFMNFNNETFSKLSSSLSNIYDLERLFRRLHLKTLHPADWIAIMTSLESVNNISILLENEHIANVSKDMCDTFHTHLNADIIGKYHLDNITNSFFMQGVNPELDLAQSKLDDAIQYFSKFAENLNMLVESTFFRVDNNEKDGYFIITTNKRFNDTKFKFKGQSYNDILLDEISAKSISTSNSNVRLCHKHFKQINETIFLLRQQVATMTRDTYYEFMSSMASKFSTEFPLVTAFIAETDYTMCCTRNAMQYRYVRPKVQKDTHSYVKLTELRHPIVERIQTDTPYVPNSIELGTQNISGMLLYGINSAGKSTMMKSVAIAIIMAQAGMYVSCKDMVFSPYENIFTRVPSGDNIMKHQSTFTVEIMELRNILQRADRHSLIVGDEIASGSETISAVAIVASAIVELCERQCSFIFATHLHEVPYLSCIRDLPKLSICHLSVTYDETTNVLIYDRKLKPGQGSNLYGLEVCRHLCLDNVFITRATSIRRELLQMNDTLMPLKKSMYNATKYLDVCEICGAKCEDVHHIQEQRNADKNGFIDYTHKNSPHNLVNLCKTCHIDVHNKCITIHGYSQTSEGVKLMFEREEEKNMRSHEDITKRVEALLRTRQSIATIISTIEKEFDVTLTRYKINTIKKTLI
jgi:DNA mismatch repair protein MutS